jgi:hypothetical protein
MKEILEEHDRLIAKINQRTKRNIYITVVCGGTLIAIIIYFGWFN